MGFHAIFVYFTKPAVEVFPFFVISWVSERFLASGSLYLHGNLDHSYAPLPGLSGPTKSRHKTQIKLRLPVTGHLVETFFLARIVSWDGGRSPSKGMLSCRVSPSDLRVNVPKSTMFQNSKVPRRPCDINDALWRNVWSSVYQFVCMLRSALLLYRWTFKQ